MKLKIFHSIEHKAIQFDWIRFNDYNKEDLCTIYLTEKYGSLAINLTPVQLTLLFEAVVGALYENDGTQKETLNDILDRVIHKPLDEE